MSFIVDLNEFTGTGEWGNAESKLACQNQFKVISLNPVFSTEVSTFHDLSIPGITVRTNFPIKNSLTIDSKNIRIYAEFYIQEYAVITKIIAIFNISGQHVELVVEDDAFGYRARLSEILWKVKKVSNDKFKVSKNKNVVPLKAVLASDIPRRISTLIATVGKIQDGKIQDYDLCIDEDLWKAMQV